MHPGTGEETLRVDWTFQGFGPSFEQHAGRHLPHYHLVHAAIGHAARYLLPDEGVLADIGASTGEATRALASANPDRAFTAHLYDVDQSMLDQASVKLANKPNITLNLHRTDLTRDRLEHEDAHLTLLLWTLQFLPPETRHDVLRNAFRAAHRDGALILAAKTRLPDPRWTEIATDALADYKSTRGVTPDEQQEKSRSLRGVMTLDSPYRLIHSIREAGWNSPSVLFRWHNWLVIGAFAGSTGGDWF